MNQIANDREARIIDAARECESVESLARVAAGIMEILAERGVSAWEALGRQLMASSQQDEIVNQLEGLLDNMEVESDSEAFTVDDERLDPEDGEIETGEEQEQEQLDE